MYSLREVENKVNQLDSMKFTDKDGKEVISGRDLAKAMGYTDWRNFKQAVNRANDQIKASGGADSKLIDEVTKELKVKNQYGTEVSRTITDYHLTRKQAINVANNCDTKKPEVALVQQYLYETSEIGERANNIYNKIKDKTYIDNRAKLTKFNNSYVSTCLDHGTKRNELGILHNACDEALYHMNTSEIKDKYGKSNRPKADFIGPDMCLAEAYAKNLSAAEIENSNLHGLDECVEASTAIHSEIREQVTRVYRKSPEELITGEDVKKVERRYSKEMQKQLEAWENEF